MAAHQTQHQAPAFITKTRTLLFVKLTIFCNDSFGKLSSSHSVKRLTYCLVPINFRCTLHTFWHNPCLSPRCLCSLSISRSVMMVVTRPRVTRPDTECLLMSPIHHQWPGPDKISFKHDQWQPQPTHANSPPGQNLAECANVGKC